MASQCQDLECVTSSGSYWAAGAKQKSGGIKTPGPGTLPFTGDLGFSFGLLVSLELCSHFPSHLGHDFPGACWTLLQLWQLEGARTLGDIWVWSVDFAFEVLGFVVG